MSIRGQSQPVSGSVEFGDSPNCGQSRFALTFGRQDRRVETPWTGVFKCTFIARCSSSPPSSVAVPTSAQVAHDHKHSPDELGVVKFPTTCSDKARPAFDRGLALLHSFGYEDARGSFLEAVTLDPTCGIAHWGVAMTYYHPIWAPPNAQEFAAGQSAAEAGAKVGTKSDRERRYIEAINAYYARVDGRDPRARAAAYRTAMEQLARDFPDDAEAKIFLALSLLATASPADRSFAQQKQAAAILNGLLETHPKHPGIQHYTIHAFDYPALATLALPAARSYAKTAPASPHALHMPSHIFTRLGLWDECISSNLDAAAAGKKVAARTHPGAASFDALHAMDYLAVRVPAEGTRPGRAEGRRRSRDGHEVRRAEFCRGLCPRRHSRALRARAARLAVGGHARLPDARYAVAAVRLRSRRHGLRERRRRSPQRRSRRRAAGTDVARDAGSGTREAAARRPVRLERASRLDAPRRRGLGGAGRKQDRRGRPPAHRSRRQGRRRGQASSDAWRHSPGARIARRRAPRAQTSRGCARRLRALAHERPEPVPQPRRRGPRRRCGGSAFCGAEGTTRSLSPCAGRSAAGPKPGPLSSSSRCLRRRPFASRSTRSAPLRFDKKVDSLLVEVQGKRPPWPTTADSTCLRAPSTFSS